MNRKLFLKAASVLAVSSMKGVSLLHAAEVASGSQIPIIDTHQHLVDFKRFGEGWSRPPVPGNYGIKEYRKATRGLNFVKAVYMEVAVPRERQHEEALYAIELCKDRSNPTVAAVIKADIYSSDFQAYMSQFKNSPYIKGIRGSFGDAEALNSDLLIENIQALGAMDMSLDFSVRPAFLPAMLTLVRKCPGTRFLINHCGNVDPRAFLDPQLGYGEADHDREQWIRDMKALAAERNVVLKISGVVTRSAGYPKTVANLAPAVNHCLDIFGPDRVMFAADWPWCLGAMDIKSWVNILKGIVSERPVDDQKKLFHDNAVRFYNI